MPGSAGGTDGFGMEGDEIGDRIGIFDIFPLCRRASGLSGRAGGWKKRGKCPWPGIRGDAAGLACSVLCGAGIHRYDNCVIFCHGQWREADSIPGHPRRLRPGPTLRPGRIPVRLRLRGRVHVDDGRNPLQGILRPSPPPRPLLPLPAVDAGSHHGRVPVRGLIYHICLL